MKPGTKSPKILIVDDEERMRHLLSIMLSGKGYQTDQAGDGEQAFEKLQSASYDMVISDIKMPKLDGIGLLKKIKEHDLPVPVVFITAFATVDSAVEVMRQGAADYITKPFEASQILMTVERTLNVSIILSENKSLKNELRKTVDTENIVYASKQMTEIMALASKVAETDAAVLISGESGTGKEVLARFIHRQGVRKDGRFVAVNCAAISPSLVESELFGHEKGSFTGADKKAQGKFEYASKGTLFLDEIGDLPLEAQAKLLRALQEKNIQRVGGNEEIPVDVRVICATNRDLPERVNSGDFRQDLFFRVNVFPIQPPPLRERMADIPPLVDYFLNKKCGKPGIRITDSAMKILLSYHWPGNVRELANVIERAVILSGDNGAVTKETLSFLNASSPASFQSGNFTLPAQGIMLEDLEKELVRQALDMSDHNQSAAARLLGLSRAKFRVLMKQANAFE